MKKFVYDSWNGVMNYDKNPLKNIPDLNTRHMVMQVLAWMWCIAFSMYFSSMWIFGVTAIAHVIILAAIVLTVASFEIAKHKPDFYLRLEKGTNGYADKNKMLVALALNSKEYIGSSNQAPVQTQVQQPVQQAQTTNPTPNAGGIPPWAQNK